jgi:hypothetical protein
MKNRKRQLHKELVNRKRRSTRSERVVVEPKPKRKEWKKSSRYRAALNRAKGHNWLRLYRLGNGGNPFYELPLGVFHEMMVMESQRMSSSILHHAQQQSPWAALIKEVRGPKPPLTSPFLKRMLAKLKRFKAPTVMVNGVPHWNFGPLIFSKA